MNLGTAGDPPQNNVLGLVVALHIHVVIEIGCNHFDSEFIRLESFVSQILMIATLRD